MRRKINFQKSAQKGLLLLIVISLCACSNSDNSSSEELTRLEKFKAIFDFSVETPDFDLSDDSTRLNLGLGQYDGLFARLNGIDKIYYDSLLKVTGGEIIWDSLHQLQTIVYQPDSSYRDPKYKVFGWHPYWMGSAYKSYNFELLSHVSWFSYDVDPLTGGYTNPSVIKDLKTRGKDLIKMAKEKNCKVLLTISNHGRIKTKQFLANEADQQSVLIDSVLQLVETLDLDGLDVNFEIIDSKYGKQMTAFLKELSDRLKSLNPDHVFSLTIPKIIRRQIDDIASLNDYVDFYVLTGYDFHTRRSKRDGPVGPLFAEDDKLSIYTVVEAHIENGLEPSKILLGLPHYGAVWTSNIFDMRSSNRNFKHHLTYRAIMAKYSKFGPPEYDEVSESVFYRRKLGPNNYEKVWFDDSLTLQKKYNWVKEKGLGGIGIWALGYDNGRTELWRTIDKSFAKNDGFAVQVKTNLVFKLAGWLNAFKVPLFISGLFFTVFIGLGFFVAMFDWRVRNYLFANKSSRLIFILTVFGLIALLNLANFFYNNYDPVGGSNRAFYLIGLLSGAIISGLIIRLYRWHRKRLP